MKHLIVARSLLSYLDKYDIKNIWLVIVLQRDRHDIIIKILECAGRSQGITKTRIMYVVMLSYKQLKEYIPYLERNELISYDKRRRVFRTTINGAKVLELYHKINELVPLHRTEAINPQPENN